MQILRFEPCEAGRRDALRQHLEERYGTDAEALAQREWARVAVKVVAGPHLTPHPPTTGTWAPLQHASAVRRALVLWPKAKANDPQMQGMEGEVVERFRWFGINGHTIQVTSCEDVFLVSACLQDDILFGAKLRTVGTWRGQVAGLYIRICMGFGY